MNLAPTNPKEALLEVCDDLLAACGHLRAIREKAVLLDRNGHYGAAR
jgi:hypothetical protein